MSSTLIGLRMKKRSSSNSLSALRQRMSGFGTMRHSPSMIITNTYPNPEEIPEEKLGKNTGLGTIPKKLWRRSLSYAKSEFWEAFINNESKLAVPLKNL